MQQHDADPLPGDLLDAGARALSSSARRSLSWGIPSGSCAPPGVRRTHGMEALGGGHGRGGGFACERWDWPAQPESVGEARDRGRVFALAHGAAGGVVDDLMLAISEATSNVVMHAFLGREPGRMQLVARARPDRLTMSVIDDGNGIRPRLDSPGLGLGLVTILRVAGGLEIRPGPDGAGTEVRMSFAAPGVRPASAV